MKPHTTRHFQFIPANYSTCPICKGERGVSKGVFVDHWPKPLAPGKVSRALCVGSGRRAAGVSSGSAGG